MLQPHYLIDYNNGESFDLSQEKMAFTVITQCELWTGN